MPEASLPDTAHSFLALGLADWATIRLIVLECGVSEGEARHALADARAGALWQGEDPFRDPRPTRPARPRHR
jgi:hypothetical protein